MFAQATQQPNLLTESRELKEETIKLERLLTDFADVPEAFSLYAQILSEQERFDKAEEYYKIALEKDPHNAALIVQRALNTMTWKNEFNEAVRLLNEAIEIDNTCEFAFETLATIEIQRQVDHEHHRTDSVVLLQTFSEVTCRERWSCSSEPSS